MDTRTEAINILKQEGSVSSAALAARLKVSRVYAQKILHDLVQEGLMFKIGKTRGAYYVSGDQRTLASVRSKRRLIKLRLRNSSLHEDQVLGEIRSMSSVLENIPDNIHKIFVYGFTEMLNNAIDHSLSSAIDIECARTETALTFSVRDYGIGAFNNIRDTFRLPGTLEAIQELLKGKRTTDPKNHSGQGIFFTSKMADVFILDSFEKSLVVNNLIRDVFITDRRPLKGTRISFSVQLSSKKTSKEVFDRFTNTDDGDFGFEKTRVTIKLFQYGRDLPSRSEAKRVVLNLENFKEVELDFSGVETVGQGFADQIFRVWQNEHPEVHVMAINVGDNAASMVRAAGGEIGQDRLAL